MLTHFLALPILLEPPISSPVLTRVLTSQKKTLDLIAQKAPEPTPSCSYMFLKRAGWCRFGRLQDRKSTRLNSSHVAISYAVFCLKKKNGTRRSSRLSSSVAAHMEPQ